MKLTIDQRFWDKVDIQTRGECWEWAAAQDADCYGLFKLSNKMYRAHRVCWEFIYGPIPEGICVLHSCDNPPCVNPEHLFLGTNQDNMDDMVEKGHLKGARNPKAKLTAAIVLDLRQTYALNRLNQKEAAKTLGVCKNSIWNAVHRQTWTHLPLDI